MLLVEVYLDKSLIHGLGVFAARDIAKDEKVWNFTRNFDLDLDPEFVKKQPELYLKQLMHYGYIDSNINRFILCCDDARFMNHSDKPNVATDYSSDKYGVDTAVRLIKAGEEITVDYNTFMEKWPEEEL